MANKAALTTIAVFLLPFAALAGDCRFTLADQSNWEGKTGFYLDLENTTSGSPASCRTQDMTIAVGVADGLQWRFIVAHPQWTLNHQYTAKAVIMPSYFDLYLDEQRIGHVEGGFVGLPDKQLLTNAVPSWAASPAGYLVTQLSLGGTTTSGVSIAESFQPDARPLPLALLAPGAISRNVLFPFVAGDSLTLTAAFTLTSVSADLRTYSPYVDTYGQSIHATFPGKILTDADLQSAASQEQTKLAAWGMPEGFDAWGGVVNAGWRDAATGFFHVVQHNSVWWLISPAGNPCFYIGLDTGPLTTGNSTPVTGREWEFASLPPQAMPYNQAWNIGDWGNSGVSSASFDTWNMIRKYGADSWQDTATRLTVQRMKAWGFSGFGKWASPAGNLPILPVLEGYDVPLLSRHADIFDPNIQGLFRASLQQQMQGSTNDPNILGWSYGNEYDEIITPDEVTAILGNSGTVPAKRALVDRALNAIYNNNATAMSAAWGVADLYNSSPAPPVADLETLRQYYADQYYEFLYRTVKRIDPNHLYFGFWIVPGWWVNETDWQLIAAHVDVIGYDRYSPVFEDSTLQNLAKSTAKPIFLGEYSFPPSYNLMRGYQIYPSANATDDADAGRQYQANLKAAARNPWCVGVAWFEYRDEPVSGRGFLGETNRNLVEGEDYAFGMVDVADRPKYDLVEQVRTTNLAMAQRRLAYAPPLLSAGGTVNNASFAANTPVAPGSLVSIFGTGLSETIQLAPGVPLPAILGTTALTLGGDSVPLIHAFPNQVDAQIPWELAGQTQAQLAIVTDGLNGETITVSLTPFSPGIYSMAGNGAGQGAVLINGTATLAAPATAPYQGKPARRGTDFINIYATGLGPVTHQPPTGAPAPASPLAETTTPVSATIGGVSATVTFAGLAPGFAGLYQVNVQVPSGAPAGDAVPVALRMGTVVSNQVTIAVE